MKKKILFCSLLVISFICAHSQQTRNTISKDFQVEFSIDYKYLLHIPKNEELMKDGKFPLIVFLHGAGERGSDVELVKVHGPPKIVENQPKFPFAVFSPQCKEGEMWDPVTLDILLDWIIKEHPIDENRVYLTGLSMGGRGTWDWAMYRPERFSAIAPICGWGNVFVSHKLKELPVWVFHGALDNVVPIKESNDLVNALKDQGSTLVKYSVYADADHDSWTKTYNNPKLYEWFLMHSKMNTSN